MYIYMSECVYMMCVYMMYVLLCTLCMQLCVCGSLKNTSRLLKYLPSYYYVSINYRTLLFQNCQLSTISVLLILVVVISGCFALLMCGVWLP